MSVAKYSIEEAERRGVACNVGTRNESERESLHSRLMQIDFQIFEKFVLSHDHNVSSWLDVKVRISESLVELVTGSSERQSCARVCSDGDDHHDGDGDYTL